jgi:adenosylhomocysteine nucleosidase
VVSGVGKVRAAQAASLLISHGVRRGILVVGVCGGLRQSLVPGTLVHCTRAAQTDFGVRADREVQSDPILRAAWRAVVPGVEGWFLTADRPVLSLWRRLRLARAFLGPCVADMETAAAAAVASRAGVPWAALRAVTDQATGGALAGFKRHYPSQAGRCADTVPGLLRGLVPPRGA